MSRTVMFGRFSGGLVVMQRLLHCRVSVTIRGRSMGLPYLDGINEGLGNWKSHSTTSNVL